MTLFLGYLGLGLMGLTLGVIGGGGSILTVPILVYFFGIPGASAAANSLFVVGACAALGSAAAIARKTVSLRTAFLFYAPSALGVILARRVLLDSLPDSMTFLGSAFSKDSVILLAFALVMVAASVSMIRPQTRAPSPEDPALLRVAIGGLATGTITGFVGAGGGFLIVPALVQGLRLPMTQAVGTSLMIITLNSWTGFAVDTIQGTAWDWALLVPVTAVALVGAVIGMRLAPRIPGHRLKAIFGWFVLVTGTVLLVSQLR